MLELLAAAVVYQATVLKVVDGDTLRVHVEGFPAAFDPIDVRVVGLDTPEHLMPPARSECEVVLGRKASDFARSLIKAGATITITYTPGREDKYRRLLGVVTLPDGRIWSDVMISARLGRPYDGRTKAPWC